MSRVCFPALPVPSWRLYRPCGTELRFQFRASRPTLRFAKDGAPRFQRSAISVQEKRSFDFARLRPRAASNSSRVSIFSATNRIGLPWREHRMTLLCSLSLARKSTLTKSARSQAGVAAFSR